MSPEMEALLEEVKQMDAGEIETLVDVIAAIAKDAADFEPTKPDPAWLMAAHHLRQAKLAISGRKGN